MCLDNSDLLYVHSGYTIFGVRAVTVVVLDMAEDRGLPLASINSTRLDASAAPLTLTFVSKRGNTSFRRRTT